ncbi:hypothetical protein E8E13_001704 [Curvularia kusanoi]|uniref:AAA+ ATPase domain-containing protein n=1 Tax=Curvularia kusanoi TaxID=90978 RepID=A0A9P4T3W1_CURKU|nr:hypothetical protein E8E13_001704 [Curvularia kusanoi]
MRLLHYNEFGRLDLTTFDDKTIPPYAILSHRWGEFEIVIEDIARNTYEEKEESFRKLKFCADQAAKDGLEYFWIDTCCIDRWNRTERSISINSMFQWYRDANRCYVFLADVSVTSKAEASQRSDWEKAFRKSEWFNRGWTLQELIAPVSVEFYSLEGMHLGSRQSLGQLIHDITDLPIAVLRNCPLEQFSTTDRIRWIEGRSTTEEEDIVYCLLGILQVSMATAYGEGQQNAYDRLRMELEAARQTPSMIPFAPNPYFIGRGSQLAEVQTRMFSAKHTATTIAILGLSGTGKSELALELAHKTAQEDETCSVFWIDASGIDNFYQSFIGVAQKLGTSQRVDPLHMSQALENCVRNLEKRSCLLVFDNTEHTVIRSNGSSATEVVNIADFLPQSKSCTIVFTTTNLDAAKALAPENIIELQEPSQDAALVMLQNRLTAPLSRSGRRKARLLLKELSYLPIAISQAAACINASGMKIQEYRSRLRKYWEVIAADQSELEPQPIVTKSPINATLGVAIEQINRTEPLALDHLYFTSCIYWKDVPIDILSSGSPQSKEHEIRTLVKYALIARRPASSALDVHQLVHQALREELQRCGKLELWNHKAIAHLEYTVPGNDFEDRSQWRRLLPHVRYTLSSAIGDQEHMDRLDLMCRCAMALTDDGDYRESERLFAQSFSLSKTILGNKHPKTLFSMEGLALSYKQQGRLEEAEQLQVQVLDSMTRLLGGEHIDTLVTKSNLVHLWQDQRRWEDAEKLNLQILEIKKRTLGEEHTDTLNSMTTLGRTYKNLGQWSKSELILRRCYQLRRKTQGDEHPLTLDCMHMLGSVLLSQHHYEEGLVMLAKCLTLRQRILGDKHPWTLDTVYNLALFFKFQNWHEPALGLIRYCFESREEVLGEHHPDTQECLEMLNDWQKDLDE